jgi:allantoinase
MLPSERLDFSPIGQRSKLELPDGARLAILGYRQCREWDPTQPMPRTVLTPPAGGAPMPDIPNWAWHEYGNRVGFWRMLEVLDDFRIRAVLAINGWAIQRNGPIARATLERGGSSLAMPFPSGACRRSPTSATTSAGRRRRFATLPGRPPRGWLGPP